MSLHFIKTSVLLSSLLWSINPGSIQIVGAEALKADSHTVAIDPGHQGPDVDMSDLEPLGPGSSEMKAKASTGTWGAYRPRLHNSSYKKR